MNKILAVCLCLSVCAVVHAAPVNGAKKALLLSSQSSGFYKPREALHIALKSHAISNVRGQLLLELDNMDVTALVQRQANRWTYLPAQPLTPGKHHLRLVFYAANGSVRELGYWLFKVRQSQYFRTAKLNSQWDLGLSQRLAERQQNQGEDFTAQGSGQLQAQLAGESWQVDSHAELMYVNDPSQSTTGRALDMTQFSTSVTLGRYTLTAGDQSLGAADLLRDGYQQRGLSSTAALPGWDSSLSVFRVRTNESLGIGAGLGVSDSDNQITGARWDYRPLESESANIYISSSYLSGRQSQPNYASLTPQIDALVHDGKAWNLTFDSGFFARQIRLRLEGARSQYDFDGNNQGADATTGKAWSALLLFAPKATSTEQPLDVKVGMEAQRVGTFYKSIANTYLPADKLMRRVFASASQDKWQWDASFAVENNNLDHDPRYATSQNTHYNTSVHYSDYQPPDNDILRALLGQATYSLTFSGSKLKDLQTPAGYQVNDRIARSWLAKAAFAHQRWQYSLGYSDEHLKDNSGWQPDTRTRGLQLYSGIQFNPRYSLNVGWQWQRTCYLVTDDSINRQIYSLDASGEFIPDRLSATLSVGLNQNRAQDDPFNPQQDRTRYVNANIRWRMKQPRNNHLGLDLTLSFAHNDYRNQIYSASDQSGYQVFLQLHTTVSSVLPGGLQ